MGYRLENNKKNHRSFPCRNIVYKNRELAKGKK